MFSDYNAGNPPSLTGGYSEDNLCFSESSLGYNNQLDWFQVTYDWHDHPLEMFNSWEGFEWFRGVPPKNNYDDGIELVCGAKMYRNAAFKGHGVHFVASGSVCSNLRQYFGSDDAVLRVLCNVVPRKVTRMDIANDVLGKNFVPFLQDASDKKQIKTRMKPHSKHQDWQVENGGQSAYWGSPSSELRVRAYDKAAEMRMLKLAWTRVEYQMRDDYATNVLKSVIEDRSPMASIKAALRARFSVDIEWFEELMGKDVRRVQVPSKTPDYERWLMGTVLGSILKNYNGGVNIDIIDRFQDVLKAELDHMKGVSK